MNCPCCQAYLTCPCAHCLCEPRYAGARRWIGDGDDMVCPACNFRAHISFWRAAHAMDALIPTENELELEGEA